MLFRSAATVAFGLLGLVASPVLAQDEILTGCICDGYEMGITYDNGTVETHPVLKTRSSNGVGWCIKDGVLLPEFQKQIRDGVTGRLDNQWVNGPWAIRFYGGINNPNPNLNTIARTVINTITSLVELRLPSCDGIYPVDSNFEPTGCDPQCSWKCSAGFEQCGDRACIDPATQACPSGVPVSKLRRSEPSCPAGATVCPTGTGGWECLNVASNLEACGGCPGSDASVDCSALPGVADVACRSAKCVASRCVRGFTLKAGVCVPSSKRFW
ncbi:hypothetical protein Q8F55_000245 [Vanrija albida]|uniref:Protein CPL1-like domain-containing protein n=1 Tax=Vanrija albida TaxID=181172 RepID=A0ABR3QCQ6_9TREE